MEIDEELLCQDLIYTANALRSTNSMQFILRNLDSFKYLNYSFYMNFNKIIFTPEIMKNDDELIRAFAKKTNNALAKLTRFMNNNETILTNMTSNFIQMNKDMDFKYYKYPISRKIYSVKEFEELILSYFATYGDRIYNIVKRYFDERRIQTGNQDADPGISGYSTWLQWLESGYVFSNYSRFNINNAGTICHELGHAIDSETFYFPQQKFIPSYSDALLELSSTAYELGFVDYLEKNHIDIYGAQMYFNTTMQMALEFIEDLNKIQKFKKLYVLDAGYVIEGEDHETLQEMAEELVREYKANRRKLVGHDPETDEKRKELYEKLCEDLDTVDEIGNDLCYNMRFDLIYGLGYYMSLHLGLIRESSIKDFNRILNNICTSRKEITLEQAINMMGISVDEFTSGKLIQPKLEENCLALKKRFKY